MDSRRRRFTALISFATMSWNALISCCMCFLLQGIGVKQLVKCWDTRCLHVVIVSRFFLLRAVSGVDYVEAQSLKTPVYLNWRQLILLRNNSFFDYVFALGRNNFFNKPFRFKGWRNHSVPNIGYLYVLCIRLYSAKFSLVKNCCFLNYYSDAFLA